MSVRRVLSSVSFDVDPESARQSPVIDTPVLHEVPWRELSEQKVFFAGGVVERVHVSQLSEVFFPIRCVKMRDSVKFYFPPGSRKMRI